MAAKKQTILDRVTPAQLATIVKGRNDKRYQYLTDLLLSSHEILERSVLPWEYKSFAEYGEEKFVQCRHMFEQIQSAAWDLYHCMTMAAQEFSNSLYFPLGDTEFDGLVIFVKSGSSYRPAKLGDAQYDFVKQLVINGLPLGGEIYERPSWANDLFLCKTNIDLHRALNCDVGSGNQAVYEASRKLRRETVWRETLNFLSSGQFAVSSVPDPETWTDGALKIQSESQKGIENSEVLAASRKLATPMPKARLVPITTVIQTVSDLSKGQASIPELVDALWQSYDCDTMMMYNGKGYGLAEALDGNPLAQYGGYNERKGIVTELFNSHYWSNLENIFSKVHGGMSTDEVLMSKEDGLRLATKLWELFILEQSFDHVTFLNTLNTSVKQRKNIDEVLSFQQDGKKEELSECSKADLTNELAVNRAAGAKNKLLSIRTGASLCPVIDLWPIISKMLGISLDQASEFVISKFEDFQLELWVDSKYDGLWRTTQNSNSSDMMVLRDAQVSAQGCSWEAAHYKQWDYQRLTPAGFKAIKNAAMDVKNADDSEQAPLISAPILQAQSRWPWGNHHTESLGHLEAASLEHWTKYDPLKPKTAPKNATVVAWLKARGVTGAMAESMATMLRADGLATGPRPSSEISYQTP